MDARIGKCIRHFLGRHEAILINIDVFRALGLQEGDAHVIRNAGGRASDALRSVIISQQLLGTREIVVVHHVSPILLHVPNFIELTFRRRTAAC